MTIKNLQICSSDVDLNNLSCDQSTSKKILYATIDKPWQKFYPKEALGAKLPEMTMYDYISQNAFQNLDRPALNYFDSIITYNSLFNNIEMVASALLSYGVKKGDVVSLITPTIPESIYLLYAINKIGAVSNLIDPRTNKEAIEKYVKEGNSDLVFIVDVASSKARDLKTRCNVKTIVNLDPTESMSYKTKIEQLKNMFFQTKKQLSGNVKCYSAKLSTSVKAFESVISSLQEKKKTFGYSKECIGWSKFISSCSKNYVMPHQSLYVDGNAPAVIVHTGGTTGLPKGVILTNNNLNSAAFDCIMAGYDFKREHNWLNIMPLFIAYGCGNGLHLPLVCKMEVIVIPAFEADMMPDLLNKYHPNHMVGVPSHYGNIISSDKLKNEDLSYVIAPTVGGDSMDVELEKRTNEFLISHNCDYKVVKGYGMTEVSAAVCACTSNETNKLGSVGIPFPHSTIAIFDPETLQELPLTSDMDSKNIGEVCISGPNVMLKYHENEEETKKIKRIHNDGSTWIHSGDLGYMNEEGELFIIGRMKDIIIRHDGFKVYPSFIEEVIMSDSAVSHCKVVGIKDDNYTQGELPYAYIVLNSDAFDSSDTFNLDDVIARIDALCHLELQEYALPIGFEIIDKLPETSIGKIDVSSLKNRANEKRCNHIKVKA